MFKILFAFFGFSTLPVENCDLLKNGKYEFIQYTPSKHTRTKITSKSRLVISNDNFTQYWSNGDSVKGRIEWVYDCTFKLIHVDQTTEESSELGKLLARSFGDYCFELQRRKGRKILFRTTYTGNLHVTTSEGMFVRSR